VIDIKLTGRLVTVLACVLVVVALLAYLTLTGGRAVASEVETAQAASTGMRRFYLTHYQFDMYEVLTACAQGYHFASLWELIDPSNLKYNTRLGYKEDDSGQGPPTGWSSTGWVRTGYISSQGSAGEANCENWQDFDAWGSVAQLPHDWTSGNQDVGVWDVEREECHSPFRVWCIED
jgi:hypothetical protein